MWQDIVLGIVSVCLSLVLVPQVIKAIKEKVHVSKITSSLTASCLFIMGATYLSLDLLFSTITACITGSLWAFMFCLSYYGD